MTKILFSILFSSIVFASPINLSNACKKCVLEHLKCSETAVNQAEASGKVINQTTTSQNIFTKLSQQCDEDFDKCTKENKCEVETK